MLNYRFLKALLALAFASLSIAYAAPASAQVSRAWVSGDGDDVNPCSRASPCRTFSGAYGKTANGGEIVCLDGNGYGGVTIAKSVTIHCPYTEGGVLVASTNGITVNAPGAIVVISGLDIEGLGQTGSPGLNGISVINVGTLHVHNTRIAGFRNGYGINFTPNTTGAQLVVDDVTITESGGAANPTTSGGINLSPLPGVAASATIVNTRLANNVNVGIAIAPEAALKVTMIGGTVAGTVGNGIVVQPVGAGGSANVSIEGAAVTSSSGIGISVNTTGNTTTAINRVQISGSQVDNNANGLAAIMPASSAKIQVTARNSTFSYNTGYGAYSSGTVAQIWLTGNTITGNAEGLKLGSPGTLVSFGDNVVFGNGASATPTPAPMGKQ